MSDTLLLMTTQFEMVGSIRLPSKWWWHSFGADPYKSEHVMKAFDERKILDGQPNFFSKFSYYSYLSHMDWLYQDEGKFDYVGDKMFLLDTDHKYIPFYNDY